MKVHSKIALVITAYGAFLFSLFLILGRVVSLDVYLFLLINSLSSPYLDMIFTAITYIGSSIFWVLMIFILWSDGKKKASLQMIYAFIIDTFILAVLKYSFLRPRPFERFPLDIDMTLGPSFPSGHSERAFSGAFILSHYYRKYSVIFYALAILVAFSRIILGFHYPLDTLIGSLNGLIVGMLATKLPTKLKKN